MKILLDENLDHRIAGSLPGCEVVHVRDIGASGKDDGNVLRTASDHRFTAMITLDKRMRFEQNLKEFSVGLIVLDIHPITLANQNACGSMILAALRRLKPGTAVVIEGPYRGRRPG